MRQVSLCSPGWPGLSNPVWLLTQRDVSTPASGVLLELKTSNTKPGFLVNLKIKLHCPTSICTSFLSVYYYQGAFALSALGLNVSVVAV